jgi:hypothetical protein
MRMETTDGLCQGLSQCLCNVLISRLTMALQVAVKVIKSHITEADLRVRIYNPFILSTLRFCYARDCEEKLEYGRASPTKTLSLL